MSDEDLRLMGEINLVAALLEDQVQNLRRYLQWDVGAAEIGHNALLTLGNAAGIVHEHTKDIARQVGRLEGKR